MKQLTVRAAKGDEDCLATMPTTPMPLLQSHLVRGETLHQEALSQGRCEIYLLHTLTRMYPYTARE